jgi:hypothetical protein
VPTSAPHNVAITMIFLILGGAVLLALAPFELGTIRLAGVSLFWWYGVVVAPVVVAAVAIVALIRGSRLSRRADSRVPATPAPAPE